MGGQFHRIRCDIRAVDGGVMASSDPELLHDVLFCCVDPIQKATRENVDNAVEYKLFQNIQYVT